MSIVNESIDEDSGIGVGFMFTIPAGKVYH